MEWLKRLGAAIDYIEENLDKEISYDEAAHIACCSTYYFQRIFSYVSGVSLSEYIRRRKMTQAAFELQRTDNKVIDVAHKYGYSSPTSFNRAFQSVHGIAPIAAKSMGCTLCAYPSIQFSIIVLGGSAMAYHIEEKKNIRIIGIRIPLVECRGKYAECSCVLEKGSIGWQYLQISRAIKQKSRRHFRSQRL